MVGEEDWTDLNQYCDRWRASVSGKWSFGFHKGKVFLDYFSDCQLLKESDNAQNWPVIETAYSKSIHHNILLYSDQNQQNVV
jgi:hypothetical protein